MNDTMSSMYDSENTPLFGGTLLEGSTPCMVLEDFFPAKQVDGTTFMHTAPLGGDVGHDDDFTYALPSPNSDWMSNKIDLNDFDFSNLFQIDESISPVAFTSDADVKEPFSPVGSDDSGISSPARSPLSTQSVCNSPPPPAAVLYDISSDDVATLMYESSPSSITSNGDSDVTESLLADLGIQFVDDVTSPSIPQVPCPTETIPTTTELRTILADSCASLPNYVTPDSGYSAKSKPGRKNKAISVQERKQRKRDQNKNAATRYRERKRQEQMEKTSEESGLLERNRTLNDKVNQISREIDYLKELMIEVYRIKGAIK